MKYDRQRLAQYGLDVEKLNQYISTAFAGGYAGEVFEGEKRFALVLRLDDKDRRSINDLRDLLVDLPNGYQIPMSELASIDYQPAPMQISRDGASRRVYVGLNARGRDIASVVADIDDSRSATLCSRSIGVVSDMESPPFEGIMQRHVA